MASLFLVVLIVVSEGLLHRVTADDHWLSKALPVDKTLSQTLQNQYMIDKEYTPETVKVEGPEHPEWKAEIKTTINKLKANDYRMKVQHRTVADVDLLLTKGTDTKKYDLVTFNYLHYEHKEKREKANADFLTPLFTSLRYRMTSPDKLEIGVYHGDVQRESTQPLCKKFTFVIPPKQPAQGEIFDCEVMKKDFKESSYTYKF